MSTVFNSPALPLLLELEDAAIEAGTELTIRVSDDGRLSVSPRAVLSEDRSSRIREHRHALRLLVQIADEGVQARASAFRQQIHERSADVVFPFLRFRATDGNACVSCGEPAVVAMCTKCQIATRLARDGDLPVDWIPAGTSTRPIAA